MKKLISICFLFFFVVIGNAQENKKPKWSEFNQDQLNLALTKSKKTIITGKILTISGLSGAIIGTATFFVSLSNYLENDDNTALIAADIGGLFMLAGITTMSIGIPFWIVGATRKKNITLELVKFNPPGPASINGVGLKIRF